MEKELEKLKDELELVREMDEQQACYFMNSNSKSEAIEAIEQEIAYYEKLTKESNPFDWEGYYDAEDERTSICESVGLTRY